MNFLMGFIQFPRDHGFYQAPAVYCSEIYMQQNSSYQYLGHQVVNYTHYDSTDGEIQNYPGHQL